MKVRPVQIIKLYFSSQWLPSLLVVLSVLLSLVAMNINPTRVVLTPFFILTLVSALGVLLAAIWNFFKRRWNQGLVNLLLLPLCLFGVVFVYTAVVFAPLYENEVANRLEIPAGIDVHEPQIYFDRGPGLEQDTFQQAMISSLATTGSDDAAVFANTAALSQLEALDPKLVLRYLSANPGWRVFNERGKIFATKRWILGSDWIYPKDGSYSGNDFNSELQNPVYPDFVSRLTIGLSGQPHFLGDSSTTWMEAGQNKAAKLTSGNQGHQSHCVVSNGSVVVELFEQSSARERRLTKAALSYLDQEFGSLANNPTWETIVKMLPNGSIRRGSASFELHGFKTRRTSTFDTAIWVNPGEPGQVYLKAYEVTQGTALSADELKKSSNEWIGWSNNADELFLSNSEITIYQGDKPYAARFEVWFVPYSGTGERKLLEKVFRIERRQ